MAYFLEISDGQVSAWLTSEHLRWSAVAHGAWWGGTNTRRLRLYGMPAVYSERGSETARANASLY